MEVKNMISMEELEKANDLCMEKNLLFCKQCNIKEDCLIVKIRKNEITVKD